MSKYCFLYYLQIDKKLKNKNIKKSIIRKIKSKSTLKIKNRIIKYGLYVLQAIFGAIFSKNSRSTTLNTKNQIIFDSFKKSYKIEIILNNSNHQNL